MTKNFLSRRDFLKISGLSVAGMALRPWQNLPYMQDFPQAERLGRVNEGRVSVRIRPDLNSQEIAVVYEDTVVPRLREVVGSNPYRFNQRWVETPDGYIWSPLIQPVENVPNAPVDTLPATSLGSGMWVEVTVPWVDVVLENPPARTKGFQVRAERGLPPRFYYSQVFWVDKIEADSAGQVWYRINERFGPGEILWGPAEAFRPLTQDEVAPITPEIEDKHILVNLARQTISCFEGKNEVFFARASTGKVGEDTDTPVGDWHRIWRKMVSTHMAGGTNAAGWDLPGIGWTTLFVGNGVAFHSTFWHNNFGEKSSRGCVNLRPDDAKFVFRWTQPYVGYDPGDMTVSGQAGTLIRVVEV
ncbi:MAG: L,D-transpeptidase family protein [Anaerolineae bacterium]|nr:L,D-transpeptidase family protein [Anaerolineae bacterium]